MKKKIQSRITNKVVYQKAQSLGMTHLQSTILANRCNDSNWSEHLLHTRLNHIPAPSLLKNNELAVKRILLAIKNKQKIGILTDYDVDGITSHAIIFYALTEFFNFDKDLISSHIGHRINQGYGISQSLTDGIIQLDNKPDIIITADCGSSDEQRIKQLKEANIDVIVTDHHAVPESGIPKSAYTTVNPNQKACEYPDKTIAGCMVAWLLMSQLRAELISHQLIVNETPKLSVLLDFVSLGTVADAVSLLSLANRAVVLAGLQVMNSKTRFAWQALSLLLKKEQFDVDDLGFQIGPRINARSRMADPFMALEFLTAENLTDAKNSLNKLDQNNIERRKTEKKMLLTAHDLADQSLDNNQRQSLVIYDQEFHAGVQGIVASRLVDYFGLPSIVLSQTLDGKILTGSARTVEKINIHGVLKNISQRYPDLLLSFGGHKGAAGLKIKLDDFERFSKVFDQTVVEMLNKEQLEPIVLVDDSLGDDDFNTKTLSLLNELKPYGRTFENPVFCNEFIVQFYQQVGQKGEHIRFVLIYNQKLIRAIWFSAIKDNEFVPFIEGNTINAAYYLMADNYNGNENIQLNIQYAELVSA
ncbi:MAG: single-stranded-DNA-specific exonuclease RecJ [Gammaproteobacteria bacterium]|nr:single-stranded-DNA-specific exonuclease RecJ [Gammaproteobacteria bacterium]